MATVPKAAERLAAYAAFRTPAFRRAAARVETSIRAQAALHSDSGAFASSIRAVQGKASTHIVSEDPLAWHKEFGHLHVNERTQEAYWVRGNFAFTNAARRLAS